jgi:peroxiredoxin
VPHDPMTLPDDLPAPVDDGAADHLRGASLPSVSMPATDGAQVDLSSLAGLSVVYAYPRTGVPGEDPLVPEWDEIPGARGCTPESCGFRDHHRELAALGARVFGLSTQPSDYQREAVERLHLPFPMLSDASLEFTAAMGLPTFDAAGQTLLKRLTLLVESAVVVHVWYPVFPPDSHASDVVDHLAAHPG